MADENDDELMNHPAYALAMKHAAAGQVDPSTFERTPTAGGAASALPRPSVTTTSSQPVRPKYARDHVAPGARRFTTTNVSQLGPFPLSPDPSSVVNATNSAFGKLQEERMNLPENREKLDRIFEKRGTDTINTPLGPLSRTLVSGPLTKPPPLTKPAAATQTGRTDSAPPVGPPGTAQLFRINQAKAAGQPYVEGGSVHNQPAGTAGMDFNTNTGEWVNSSAPSLVSSEKGKPVQPFKDWVAEKRATLPPGSAAMNALPSEGAAPGVSSEKGRPLQPFKDWASEKGLTDNSGTSGVSSEKGKPVMPFNDWMAERKQRSGIDPMESGNSPINGAAAALPRIQTEGPTPPVGGTQAVNITDQSSVPQAPAPPAAPPSNPQPAAPAPTPEHFAMGGRVLPFAKGRVKHYEDGGRAELDDMLNSSPETAFVASSQPAPSPTPSPTPQEYARGGRVAGRPVKRDVVPAMLSPGEDVLNANQQRRVQLRPNWRQGLSDAEQNAMEKMQLPRGRNQKAFRPVHRFQRFRKADGEPLSWKTVKAA